MKYAYLDTNHGGTQESRGASRVQLRVPGTPALLTQHLTHYMIHDALNILTIIMSEAYIIQSLSCSNNGTRIL